MTDPAGIAYHEAGHIVLADALGGSVRESTIESELDGHGGHTTIEWAGLSETERMRRSALVAIAGPVAEILWRGEEIRLPELLAWSGDWDEFSEAAQRLADSGDEESIRRRWIDEVVGQLRDELVWERVCRVADALEAHGSLDNELIEDALGS